MQKMEKIDNGDRTTKACETEVSGRIDYGKSEVVID